MKTLSVVRAVVEMVFAASQLLSCTGHSATPTATEELARQRTPCPAEASLGDIWIRPADNAVMVYVLAGEFLYGPGRMTDVPKQLIVVDGFWIDRTEVTNAQYTLCVADGECEVPLLPGPYRDPARANYPVIWVSRMEAEAYCRWAGVRLPMEIEWEKAARGTDGRMYPWGDVFDASRVNYYWSGIGEPQPVGTYSAGASPYGALDMAGNVCEWVQELWRTNKDYVRNPILPPGMRPKGLHPVGHHYTLRGGSWASLVDQITTYARNNEEPVYRSRDTGFRCACSPGPPSAGVLAVRPKFQGVPE